MKFSTSWWTLSQFLLLTGWSILSFFRVWHIVRINKPKDKTSCKCVQEKTHREQCDQMARQFAQYLVIYKDKICPIAKIFAKIKVKHYTNANTLPRNLTISPKWQNYAKSGHTDPGRECLWMCRREQASVSKFRALCQQCDQMGTLFYKIWPFTTMTTCPIA